jgi:hypothetical protein
MAQGISGALFSTELGKRRREAARKDHADGTADGRGSQ